eukprot:m.308723 g.308723  ORF g.308723 m.308723 type:complete len:71 (-) comp55332_c0_seq9:381-593(-)
MAQTKVSRQMRCALQNDTIFSSITHFIREFFSNESPKIVFFFISRRIFPKLCAALQHQARPPKISSTNGF